MGVKNKTLGGWYASSSPDIMAIGTFVHPKHRISNLPVCVGRGGGLLWLQAKISLYYYYIHSESFKQFVAGIMFITRPSACRSSKAVEEAVSQLVDMLKSPLTEGELKDMIPEPEENPNNEPDAYTLVLNCFTQKNTDALIKCKWDI